MKIDLVSSSIRACASSYRPHILTTNFSIQPGKISWNGYNPGIEKGSYAADYARAINERQYSFLLTDNSFFQFYYQFDNEGELDSAKLAFYPNPSILKTSQLDLERLIEHLDGKVSGVDLLFDFLEDGVHFENSTHLRLDFDRRAVSHCKNHLQLSALNEFRLPVQQILNPFIFFDLIMGCISESEIYADVSRKQIYQSKRKLFSAESHLKEIDYDRERHLFVTGRSRRS